MERLASLPLAERLAQNAGHLALGLAASLGVATGGAMGGTGIAGGLLLFALVALADRRIPRPDPVWSLLVAALLAVVAISGFFAPFPARTGLITVNIVTTTLPLLLWSAPALQERLSAAPIARWGAWLLMLGMAVVGAQLLLILATTPSDIGEFGAKMNRGMSWAALFFWPLLGFLLLTRRRAVAVLLVLAFLATLALSVSRATQLGVAAGVAAFVAAGLLPRLAFGATGGIVLAASLWPFGAKAVFESRPDWLAWLPTSWGARMEIWDFAAWRILERPLVGWGVGSGPSLAPTLPHSPGYGYMREPVMHAHNLFAQSWVELGIPGLLVVLAMALWSLSCARRLPARIAPFALAAFVTGFVILLFSYDLWSDSLLAALTLNGVLFAVLGRWAATRGSETLSEGVPGTRAKFNGLPA